MRSYFSPFIPVLVIPLLALSAYAQHGGHVMPDGSIMSDHDVPGMDMSRPTDVEILTQPMGSGTSWLPAGSPVHNHAYHFMAGDWMFMTHGEITARYTGQNLNNPDRNPPPPTATGGTSLYPELERGSRRFDAPNWIMLSAERPVFNNDRLMLRTMMSLDPLTIGDEGYPLVFQTGEGLVDRQHAHDLFMELALLYVHPLTETDNIFAYIGLPGEPAIGPTAFMHRPSAGSNPDAPLAHHFQDATHITYGVVTLGWVHRKTKAEISAFRGREPDDKRWNIDVGALDSYSFRLTQNIGRYSLQGSTALIHDPEPGEHGDIVRTTASITYNRPLQNGNWATTLIYGMNAGHHGEMLHSFLRESAIDIGRMTLWSRFESLQRLGSELDLPAPRAESNYWVNALTLGAGANLFTVSGFDVFLGGQGGVNLIGSGLERYYGKMPLSGQVFIKVRPAAMKMSM